MLLTTTPSIEGRSAREYLGIVTGEAIIGANILKDIMAAVRDVVGGRARAYEDAVLLRARMHSVRWLSTRRAWMRWSGSISTTRCSGGPGVC